MSLKQWFWFFGITHGRQLTISILREWKGKSLCDGGDFKIFISAPSTYAPFHITVSNHSIWESVLPCIHHFLCSLTLCRWEPLPLSWPWGWMDTAAGAAEGRNGPCWSHAGSLSHGHQLSAFLNLIEMHKNQMSNLTKLPTNYKVLFAISYVISFWKSLCFLSLWMHIQSRQICRHTIRSWFWKEVNKLHWLKKGFLLPFYYEVHRTCYKFFTLHFYHKDKWNCQSCSHFLLMAIYKQ